MILRCSLLLCFSLWILLLRLGAAADPAAHESVDLPSGGAAATATHDFGSMSLLDSPQLVCTFFLVNTSSEPLTLVNLVPSCHCTTAVLASNQPMPATLFPGKPLSVEVTVAVEPYMTGPLDKSVDVYLQGRDSPAAVLTMEARLHPLVTITPASLDFGTVPAGRSPSFVLTAVFDKRLVPSHGAPQMAASDPDLEVTALSSASSAVDGTEIFTYRVQLAPDAALGPLRSQLNFVSQIPMPALPEPSVSYFTPVPVTGSVIGTASALLSSLAFGIVAHGSTPEITDLLKGNADLLAAKVESTNPDVAAQWGRGSQTERDLLIRLSPVIPPGLLQSLVIVRLANGQILRLPVSGYVTVK